MGYLDSTDIRKNPLLLLNLVITEEGNGKSYDLITFSSFETVLGQNRKGQLGSLGQTGQR